MSNPNQTDLDFTQALKRCVNSQDDSLRVELGSATGFNVALSAAEGDSVLSVAQQNNGTGSVTSSNGATDVVVAAMDVSQSRELQLFCDVGAGLTGSATAIIEISPSDSANVWISSGISLALSGSANLKSTKVSDIAKRARIKLSANSITVGTASLYLIARS